MLINTDYEQALSFFWVAFPASAVAAYPVYRLLIALKSRQTVSQYAPEGHQVKQGTPTMGGIIVLVGVIVGLFVRCFPTGNNSTPAFATLGLVVAFALIGFIDDFVVPRLFKGKRGLGWKQKILMELVASVLGIYAVGVPLLSLDAGVAVFVILFFSNAYNFSDGLDGLSGSLAILIFCGLAALGGVYGFRDVSPSLIVIGATLPFLFLNAPPAKLFMGDVGSLPIGALMGVVVLSLLLNPAAAVFHPNLVEDRFVVPNTFIWSAQTVVPLLILSLVMIAELVPPPMQIFWVKVFKKKLFPYTPIHHAFEKAGWKETRVVFVFAIVQIVCIAAAVSTAIAMRPQVTGVLGVAPFEQNAVR